MENLLTQLKEIKRMQTELDLQLKEEQEERAQEDEEAKQRAIRDFELLQMGLELRSSRNLHGPAPEQQKVVGYENGELVVEEVVREDGNESKSKKRKFELDEGELMRIAREERQKKKIEISEEKVRFTGRISHSLLTKKIRKLHPQSSYPHSGFQALRHLYLTLMLLERSSN